MSHLNLKGTAYLKDSSQRVEAVLKVRGDDIALGEETCHISELIVDAPLGALPRKITLPSGTLFETEEFDKVTELTGKTWGGLLANIEVVRPQLLAWIGAAVFGVYLVWRFALPALIWLAVAMTPGPVKTAMDRGTMQTIDFAFLEPSSLSAEQQAEAQALFDHVVSVLPKADQEGVSLQFRSMGEDVPNALALPGGTIVLTDALVRDFDRDTVAGVIGHELGHVVEEHGLQQLYRSIGIYVLVALIAGETGPILEEMLLEGNLLLSLTYSRAHEREADAFAVALSKDAGYDPMALVRFFEHIGTLVVEGGGMPDFLSTHPAPRDRIEAITAQIEAMR